MIRKIHQGVFAVPLAAAAIFVVSLQPSFAGTISFTCAANIDATVAGTCNTLNTTIADLYSSTFSDANASIYIQYGTTGLASSLQFSTNVSYTDYANALAAHEGDANDVIAVASLGGNTTDPVNGSDGVTLTSALATVLGLTTDAGSAGINLSDAACTLGNTGCYNGIETLSNSPNTFYYRSGPQDPNTYDIFSAVEHETDEVLGTPSCITGSGNNAATITTSVNCTNNVGPDGTPLGVSAADLFRYASPGTRSYLGSADGSVAYFSINDGTTNLADYNNQPNGADYGDWDGASLRVQNAFGTPGTTGTDITNDGGSEIAVLDAIGYNLTSTTPEPGTLGTLGFGFAALGVIAYLRRRNRLQA